MCLFFLTHSCLSGSNKKQNPQVSLIGNLQVSPLQKQYRGCFRLRLEEGFFPPKSLPLHQSPDFIAPPLPPTLECSLKGQIAAGEEVKSNQETTTDKFPPPPPPNLCLCGGSGCVQLLIVEKYYGDFQSWKVHSLAPPFVFSLRSKLSLAVPQGRLLPFAEVAV